MRASLFRSNLRRGYVKFHVDRHLGVWFPVESRTQSRVSRKLSNTHLSCDRYGIILTWRERYDKAIGVKHFVNKLFLVPNHFRNQHQNRDTTIECKGLRFLVRGKRNFLWECFPSFSHHKKEAVSTNASLSAKKTKSVTKPGHGCWCHRIRNRVHVKYMRQRFRTQKRVVNATARFLRECRISCDLFVRVVILRTIGIDTTSLILGTPSGPDLIMNFLFEQLQLFLIISFSWSLFSFSKFSRPSAFNEKI